jgi:hypothetical protein
MDTASDSPEYKAVKALHDATKKVLKHLEIFDISTQPLKKTEPGWQTPRVSEPHDIGFQIRYKYHNKIVKQVCRFVLEKGSLTPDNIKNAMSAATRQMAEELASIESAKKEAQSRANNS